MCTAGHWLVTQAGVEGTVLSHKFVDQARWLEIQAAFLCYSLEAQFLLLQEVSVFIPKDFN